MDLFSSAVYAENHSEKHPVTPTGESELAPGGKQEGFPFSFPVLGNITNDVKIPLVYCMQSNFVITQMTEE